MAPQELDKVLSIESFAEVTKRNGDDNELDSLKIMPLNGMKEKKTYHPLGIVHSREFQNSKEIHRKITQDTPSNSFSKGNEKSQPQPQKKERPMPSLIQATRIELF